MDPPSLDRSGGTVAECCAGSKAGAEEVECRGGKIEGETLEPKLMPGVCPYIGVLPSTITHTPTSCDSYRKVSHSVRSIR